MKYKEHPVTHEGRLIGTALFPLGVRVKPEEYAAVKNFLLSIEKARAKKGRKKCEPTQKKKRK